ncbi:hypothetical protein L4D13_05600, partial [Photobacterium profundum]
GLTTGRTVFVGLILGLGAFFIIEPRKKIVFLFWMLFSILLVILIFNLGVLERLSFPQGIIDSFYFYSRFAFEFIYNFIYTGEISTASTDRLSDMFFLPSIGTILFGDGLYTNFDGSYYMHTDSGYMRQMLLFGIGGVLSFFAYTFLILRAIAYYFFNKTYLLSLLILLFCFSILHYKGEVLGYLIIINETILFIAFSGLAKNILIKKET